MSKTTKRSHSPSASHENRKLQRTDGSISERDENLPFFLGNKRKAEYEISYDDEAGLGQAFDDCKKHPGHPEFIPVADFGVEHVPDSYPYPREDIVAFIRSLQVLTCRIKIRQSSEAAEKCVTGTGFVTSIRELSGKEFEVYVDTCLHVVSDNDTAVKATEVEFFYDDKYRKDVKILQGWELGASAKHSKNDWCSFICKTDDIKFVKLLQEKMNSCRDLNGRINRKLTSQIDFQPQLTIIVSHPHGCAKQISVGEWVKRKQAGVMSTKYLYDTCTCPGSSGAMVWRAGCPSNLLFNSHPHMKRYEKLGRPNGKILNKSAIGIERGYYPTVWTGPKSSVFQRQNSAFE